MSEQTSQEPTMEEILASIRRIISEDDAPASADAAPGDPPAVAAEAVAEPEPAPEPEPELEPVAAAAPVEPEPVAETEEEVLELTDRVESHGDLDVYPADPAPALEPEPAPAPAPPPVVEAVAPVAAIVSTAAATAAASAFGQLSAAIAMPKGERTLEDVVRELLQPLLKDWLDTNLPRIVEAAVQEEVERIARGRVR